MKVRQRHNIVHVSSKVRSMEGRTSSSEALDGRSCCSLCLDTHAVVTQGISMNFIAIELHVMWFHGSINNVGRCHLQIIIIAHDR